MEIKFEYSEAIELSGGYEDGYKDGYATGTQDATPTLQEKAVTPGKEPREVIPDEGYDALSSVIVAGDEELVPENLIEGAEVFGVAGIDKGYATGYAEGEQSGQTAGYASGRADGYSEGHADGEAAGHEAGYAEGYSKGAQDAAPTLQAKSVKPGANAKTVLPDEGFDALSRVEVEGDANLVAENIVEGVNIFDIEGNAPPADTTVEDWMVTGADAPEKYANSRVTSIRKYAFCYCVSTPKEMDFAKVEAVEMNAFANCTQLEKIDLPALTTMQGKAFSGCSNLKTVNMPLLETITNTTRAFENCTSLEEISLPNLTTAHGQDFGGCSSLKKVDLPVLNSVPSKMFYTCFSLEAIIFRKSDTIVTLANSDGIPGTIAGYIYVPRALLDTYASATNWSVHAGKLRAIEDYPDIVGGAA